MFVVRKVREGSLFGSHPHMKLNKLTIITLGIGLVGGGLGVALLLRNAPSSYRATEMMTQRASAPTLPSSELKPPPPVILNDSEKSPANAGLHAQEILRSAQDDRLIKGWRVYENKKYGFTLEYPPTWSVTETGADIFFRPKTPAYGEVESDPRIALTTKLRAEVMGAYKNEDAWFDAVVLKNFERFDAKKTTANGLVIYTFSEGAGEYPHDQAVVFKNGNVYWFEVEASDPSIHDAFKKLVATVRFAP